MEAGSVTLKTSRKVQGRCSVKRVEKRGDFKVQNGCQNCDQKTGEKSTRNVTKKGSKLLPNYDATELLLECRSTDGRVGYNQAGPTAEEVLLGAGQFYNFQKFYLGWKI